MSNLSVTSLFTRNRSRFLMIVCGVALAGCDRTPAPLDTSARPTTVPGSAIIRGTVRFLGTRPTLAPVADASCHHAGIDPINETVIISPEGGLVNAVVWIENGPLTNGSSRIAAVLDQRGCRFVPHVLALQVGQPLEIRSSDPMPHNVHATPQQSAAFNYSLARPGEKAVTRFGRPEFVRLRCDIHPSMVAWAAVVDTSFVAVTDAAGGYEIRDVPAGTYSLAMWHEQYGVRRASITVSNDAPVIANYEVSSP